VYKDENGKSFSLSPEPPLKNLPAVMAEIEAYSLDLKAIAAADNSESVGKSVDSISVELNKLATMTGQQGFGPVAEAAGSAVKWAIGQYVESVKLDALRKATAAANPVIANAATYASDVAIQAHNAMSDALSEEVNKANDAYVRSKSAADAKALIAST